MQNPGLYAAPGLVVGGKQKTIQKALLSNEWVFPKIGGKPPKSSHFNRVSPYFHHPFWCTLIFGDTCVFFLALKKSMIESVNRWRFTLPEPVKVFGVIGPKPSITPLKTNECPLKINGWKMYFLLKWFLFWGHVNFQGGICLSICECSFCSFYIYLYI